ncbi:FecR domain-containing protein [Sphingosinicella sp. CPCC 101087]|uniref:FecR domain-containing protein n=1 Tax=Sphingosinicella sp. CPCC 101087 TaxID=2497754 RepID=UPI00101C03C1|nr:FecR domain-containing protein [Sphingosinicella sp. CPCC 101087]
MTRGAIIAALVAFLLPVAASAASPPGPADPVLYTTRQGDNLYTLAQRYFVRTADYVRVQRLNRVIDPYRLPVGRTLRIPRALLRHEPLTATVIAMRGQVRVTRGGREVAVAEGTKISEGDEISTAANAFVSLRLEDGSTVSLPSRSRVGVRRLRRVLLTGGIERSFALEAGRTRAVVTPAENEDDGFRISTPVSVSAVRGTEFRARFEPDSARAATEVIDGTVAVAANAEADPVALAAGFGAVSTAAGTSPPVPLLPAPELRRPGKVQDEPELNFEVEPLENAAAYRVQVARDAGFLDVAADETAQTPNVTLPPVPDGTWFVRASALDAQGLEGLAATYSFQRRLQQIETALEQRQAGRYREYLFRWIVEGSGTRQYRFQLMKDRPDATPMVDEAGLTTGRFVVTDLPEGTYYWRVMSVQFVDGSAFAKWSAMEQLTITPDE